MKKVITILLLGFTLVCHGQSSSDVHRKYMYSLDNQMDNINGLSFGMMQLSLLQNNRLRSFSSENTFFSTSSLEQNTTSSVIRNEVNKNAATVGFDNWAGYTVQGNFTSKKYNPHSFGISASVNAIDRQNKLEGSEIQNRSAGFLVNGDYSYNKNKIYVKSNLEIDKDKRNYDVVSRPSKLHIDNNYGSWSNFMRYQISANSKLETRASLIGYGGSIGADSFRYEGRQSLATLGTSWKQMMNNVTLTNGVTFQTLLANNLFSRRQNRWEYSNVITPGIKNAKVGATIKNAIIYTDSTSFFYAPSLALTYSYGNKSSVQLLANRFLRTQTNSLERWPYYSYSDEGIQNITGEQLQGYNTIWLKKDFRLIQMLRYQRFSDFSIAGNSLASMARASVGVDRRTGSYQKWNYSGIYHYRFAGEGELAKLAPLHTVVANVSKRQIKAKLINKLAKSNCHWDGNISTGYRSRAATLFLGEVTGQRMRNLFFTDVSYTLTNRRYNNGSGYYGYNGRDVWFFTIEAQNIFNAQALTSTQQESTALLLTEGIRTARQIKVGLTYMFR